ncbi:unnamed protein product [Diamesa tonsa]
MSIIQESTEFTNVNYQVIESNFVWDLKKSNAGQKSKIIEIPLMNGQWYLNTYSNGVLVFHLDIIKEDKVELSNEINSNKYQYLFEATWGGYKYGGTDYKELLTNINDTYQITHSYSNPQGTIKGKVSFRIIPKVAINLEIIRKKLCDDFNTLMFDSTHSDFTIIVASKEFKVHKSVMSARSTVFMKMFETNMKEAADNKVEIIDVDKDVFEQLLIFVYSGKIPVNLDLYAMDLFVAADKYEIEDLKDLSEKHISLNVTMDNAMDVFNLANHYTCNYDLKKISLKFIKDIHSDFTIIVASKEFKVHKSVMSAHSPVFMKMFESNMKEAKDNKVEIIEVDPNVFEQLLIYIYSGKIADTAYFAMDLFVAADKVCLSNHIVYILVYLINLQYGVQILRNYCEKCISIDLKNNQLDAIDVYKLANLYSCHELKKTSFEMIKQLVSIRIIPKVSINLEIIRKKLSDDLNALMLDSTHSDFTIIVESNEFKVHKSMLSARSPVFMKMFESNMKEAADNKVEINDVDPDVFEQLLIFIYSGKIPVNLDLYAMELFVAADKYKIEDLKDLSEKHISLNVTMDNAMAVFNLANHYTCNYDLKKISLKFIKESLSFTSGGSLTFRMKEFENRSSNCQYCFEVVVNGGTKLTQGFKTVTKCVTESYSVKISEEMIIEAKVTIKLYGHLSFDQILKKLSDDLNALMLDSTHSDFTIIVESNEFKVHKSVMSAHSPVFMKMFESNMKEAKDNKVEIIDVDSDVFEQLLIYIYSGKIADIGYYAMDLFVAADKVCLSNYIVYNVVHLINL